MILRQILLVSTSAVLVSFGVSPIVGATSQPLTVYPSGTVLESWQWVRAVPMPPTDQSVVERVGGLLIQSAVPPTPTPAASFPILAGPWVQFPPAWTRIDSVAALQAVATHARAQWPAIRLAMAPPHGTVHYSADLKAAMTIQQFNPGSVGLTPLVPSPRTMTPATDAWLIAHGWGLVLARYFVHHPHLHVTLPRSLQTLLGHHL